MNINLNNYEAFFIDYLDGNLTTEEFRKLEVFLDLYPDLKAQIQDLEMTKLEPEKFTYPLKDKLRKSNTDLIPKRFNGYEDFMISKVEGDLTDEEENLFNLFLESNPVKEKDYLLFLHTILKPDPIGFVEKSSLKRPLPIISRYRKTYWYAASVAAMLLVLMIFVFNDRENESTGIRHRAKGTERKTHDFAKAMGGKTLDKNKLSVRQIASQVHPDVKEASIIDNDSANKDEIVTNNYNNDQMADIISLRKEVKNKMKNNNLARYNHMVQETDENENEKLSYTIRKSNNYIALFKTMKNGVNFDASSLKPNQKNFPSDLSPNEFLISKLKSNILKIDDGKNLSKHKITIWDFAHAALHGFNKVTGKKIEFDQQFDSNGNIVKLIYSSKSVAFIAPVRKSK